MNFHAVFSAVSALAFVFEFPVNLELKQDYFYLEGQNQSAQLSRTNSTISLYLVHGENFSLFSETMNQSSFKFSWKGYKIDGKPMKLERSEGQVLTFAYKNFLFLSPILNELEECSSTCPEQILHYDGVNYWYIIVIVLIVGITIDSKEKGLKISRQFLALFSRNPPLKKSPDSATKSFL